MSSHALVGTRKEEREREELGRRSDRSASRPAAANVQPQAALGGEPHVSLLPLEVNDFHKAKAVRRRLALGVVGVLVVVVAGVAGSYLLSVTSQSALDASRATGADLVAQEAKFAELRQIKSGIALVQAGQIVGASTEIDWKKYLGDLQGTLPAGVAVNDVTITSASPFEDFAQSSVPLEGSRVATLTFTAVSPTLPSIPDWLDGLGTLTGFADAVPGTVDLRPDGSYLVNITMHINADAFALRFSGEKSK